MSSISQFFGGTQVVTPATGLQTNYSFVANTEFSNPTNTAGSSEYIRMTPMSDTHFLVTTGNTDSSANDSFLQLFRLNSDGTVVQIGSNLNIGNILPLSISANGVYGILVARGLQSQGGYIYKITWDGNTTVSLTQLVSDGDGTNPTTRACITTVLTDGRLMGLYSRFANNRFCEYAIVDTDGNTGTVVNKTTNFTQSSADQYFAGCGTGDGIYISGIVYNTPNRLNGMKIYPRTNSTTVPDSGEAYTQNSDITNAQYLTSVPTPQGSVVTNYLSNGNSGGRTYRRYFMQTGYQPVHFEQYSSISPSNGGSEIQNGMTYLPEQNEQYGAIDAPVKRTYNGTYQDRICNLVAIDASNNMFPTMKNPLYSVRPVVGANSSISTLLGTSPSCLMGTRIVRLINDYSNEKYNFNVWNTG